MRDDWQRIEREARSQAEDEVAATYRPLGELLQAITKAADSVQRQLLASFGVKADATPSEPQTRVDGCSRRMSLRRGDARVRFCQVLFSPSLGALYARVGGRGLILWHRAVCLSEALGRQRRTQLFAV